MVLEPGRVGRPSPQIQFLVKNAKLSSEPFGRPKFSIGVQESVGPKREGEQSETGEQGVNCRNPILDIVIESALQVQKR